ncbi:MAG: ribulokinase [Planctomycetes bacterium]|nr:ribulokinase [Planctomycetota bacterium]NOG53880.1 ribulokinase [Planctomycetota bacterium]
MAQAAAASIGLDFGTDSVRAVIVGLDGTEHGSAVSPYEHGQIIESLPGQSAGHLPPHFALQHAQDWLDSAANAVRHALAACDVDASRIIGIGVDFTSCTMLPCLSDGTPLCRHDHWHDHPHAWPKLWKHHGAVSQTDDLNRVARERNEPWLAAYGGTIGLEWLFPKMLEIFDGDRPVFDAADIFLEAGDWFVWQITDGEQLVRSTCQAGYKACWSADTGYPAADLLNSIRPGFGDSVLNKLPGTHQPPGSRAGVLSPAFAETSGLPAGIPVATAIIDAHAGVPGVGAAEPGQLVIVMGTSSCHMLCSSEHRLVPGAAGIVADGILPGYTGYELGQAAVGDAFAWLHRVTGRPLAELADEAAALEHGAGGVSCLDFFNGCRTPLMDGSLTGSLHGLTLATTPAQLYRSILEATAYGTRWIVDLLTENGVPVEGVILTGGLPHAHPVIPQVYADVLGRSVAVHPAKHGPATGAAILGAMAADASVSGFSDIKSAVASMSPAMPTMVEPREAVREIADVGYARYRELAESHY